MRNIFGFLLLFVFGSQSLYAQFFKDNFYYEGEIGGITSFFVTNPQGETKFFTYGGVSFRGGLGIHNQEESLFLGIYSGMEANIRHDTGILPIYLNSKIAFDISDNGKIILSYGYGKSFLVGTENYKGYLRKYTIAYARNNENEAMESFFIEANNHGFNFPDGFPAITINIGFTYTFL